MWKSGKFKVEALEGSMNCEGSLFVVQGLICSTLQGIADNNPLNSFVAFA